MTAKTEQLAKIWKSVLADLETTVQDRTLYASFLLPSYLWSLDGNKAVVVTDSVVSKTVLSRDYSSLILNSLRKTTQSDYSLEIISQDDLKGYKSKEEEKPSGKRGFFANSALKPEYSFENFVVGKSNKEAYQAAVAVTKHPGEWNPLFIYSKSGLGKTHLLFAIGNAVKNANPALKVLYITSEDFIDEYIRFVQADSDGESLKDFFRSIDFLLIDDIQFLAGKTKTGEMFFNVFNILVSQKKQIVITSDRSPAELEGLEDRLVSRFSQGLSVSIDKPEKKTLIEILKTKIKANGFNDSLFDDDALEYIADNNSKNIRVLEGALNRILFFNVSYGNTNRITLQLVKEAFADEGEKKKPGQLTPEIIIDEVAKYYNLTESQILSKVRTLQISLARAVAMYLCRNMLSMSFAAVGQAFEGKDHTTVLAACEKVDNMLKTDDNMKRAMKTLQSQLKA
jgi:chromosomal replication initiator protein